MCEATAQLLMMTGAAHLPGALLPLLMQTVLLWNVVFSSIIFGTRSADGCRGCGVVQADSQALRLITIGAGGPV